jgi:hypothetical protein
MVINAFTKKKNNTQAIMRMKFSLVGLMIAMMMDSSTPQPPRNSTMLSSICVIAVSSS